MNKKNLLLLATLLCAVPGVSYANYGKCGHPSRLGYALGLTKGQSYWSCECNPDVWPTDEQFERVHTNPTDPSLDPFAICCAPCDKSILTEIVQKNPNIELQAVAARIMGRIHSNEASELNKDWYDGHDDNSFEKFLGSLQTAKRYCKKSRDLLATLNQEYEIQDAMNSLDNKIMKVTDGDWMTSSAEQSQQIIDMVTNLGYEVDETAKEHYACSSPGPMAYKEYIHLTRGVLAPLQTPQSDEEITNLLEKTAAESADIFEQATASYCLSEYYWIEYDLSVDEEKRNIARAKYIKYLKQAWALYSKVEQTPGIQQLLKVINKKFGPDGPSD